MITTSSVFVESLAPQPSCFGLKLLRMRLAVEIMELTLAVRLIKLRQAVRLIKLK